MIALTVGVLIVGGAWLIERGFDGLARRGQLEEQRKVGPLFTEKSGTEKSSIHPKAEPVRPRLRFLERERLRRKYAQGGPSAN